MRRLGRNRRASLHRRQVGVMGFSRSLYEEVRKDGIRISVVCLAAVNTRFIDVAGL